MGYKLDDIVSEWLIQSGKPENQRARLYLIALSGLRELHIDVNGIIKVVELCINDTGTVDLPNDFINYRKIGILGGDGRIHCLGRDNNIGLIPNADNCGVPVHSPNTQGVNYPFYGMPFSGSFYGVAGGNNSIGHYRLDRKTNQLWLANMNILLGKTIVLEYIADINSEDGDFFVHPYSIQCVKSWISWQYVIGDRNTNLGEKQLRRSDYYNYLRLFKSRYGSSTPEEWANALRSGKTSNVRF